METLSHSGNAVAISVMADGEILRDDASDASGNDVTSSLVVSDEEMDELTVLREAELFPLVLAGDIEDEHSMCFDIEVTNVAGRVVLRFTLPETYPVLFSAEGIVAIRNVSMSRNDCDALRRRTRELCNIALSSNTIYHLRAEALDPVDLVQSLVDAAQSATRTKKPVVAARDQRAGAGDSVNVGGAATEETKEEGKEEVQTKLIATEYTASELARKLIGSPDDLVRAMPPEMRVLHIEEVLRHDLARRFLEAQEDLRGVLGGVWTKKLAHSVPQNIVKTGRKDEIVEHLVQPRLAFHGTSHDIVGSVVRHGFVKPGQKLPGTERVHEVRCGSTWGKGVYCSPDASYSLSYSGDMARKPQSAREYFGIKLIACAVIMGRSAAVTHDDERRGVDGSIVGSDSHVSPNGLEYVIFEPARIIPVYVVHLDWGDDNMRHTIFNAPENTSEWQDWMSRQRKAARKKVLDTSDATSSFAGDRQRTKEAVMARARKWFPYGYGASTGDKFQVLEVGEVSEDEEVYGTYQRERIGDDVKSMSKEKVDYWKWAKAGYEEDMEDRKGHVYSLDEFTQERTGATTKRAPFAVGNGVVGMQWDEIPSLDEDGYEADGDEDLGLNVLLRG